MHTRAHPSTASHDAGLPLQRQRVLIVDDDRTTADMLAAVLAVPGRHVEVVYSGRAALDALDAARPHVVLLDIGMYGTDGCDVARHIRALDGDDDAAETLIIAVSGYEPNAVDADSLVLFDHYLIKPVDLDAIEALLDDRAPA